MINLSLFEACLFDLDGTLIDSMGMWKDIDIEYLGILGKPMPENLQRNIEGLSFNETAVYFKSRFEIEDSLEEIKSTWHKMSYNKYVYEIDLKPGVIEFLRQLKNKNIKTAICSSNNQTLINDFIVSHKIENLVDVVVTCDDVGKNKPEPDVYLRAAELLNITPKKCLVFEDVPNGLIAGSRAGMPTVAVFDEYSKDVDEKKRNLSDYYISGFEKEFYE